MRYQLRRVKVCILKTSLTRAQARNSQMCLSFTRIRTRSKVAVLAANAQQTDPQCHTASVIHVIANCYYRALGQRLWNKYRPTKDYTLCSRGQKFRETLP